MKDQIEVVVADESHEKYVDTILETISEAAKVRGTGIAKRTHEYLLNKMREAKAVIALDGDKFAGFSYIETWQDKKYVTTSGLIVHPDYRGRGLAKRIKDMTFTLARIRWPHAKITSPSRLPTLPRMKLSGRVARVVSTWTSCIVQVAVTASAPVCCMTPRSICPPRYRTMY